MCVCVLSDMLSSEVAFLLYSPCPDLRKGMGRNETRNRTAGFRPGLYQGPFGLPIFAPHFCAPFSALGSVSVGHGVGARWIP